MKPSFTDNGDGTVMNSITGLMWQTQDDATIRSWDAALAYCEGLSLASCDDWRLPNIKELSTLADTSRSDSPHDPVFGNLTASYFWSSTTYVAYTPHGNDARHPYLQEGQVLFGGRSVNTLEYVLCVRGQ